jgi:hypothetical protein
MRARAIEVFVNMVVSPVLNLSYHLGVRKYYGAPSPQYVKQFTFANFFEIGLTVSRPLAAPFPRLHARGTGPLTCVSL